MKNQQMEIKGEKEESGLLEETRKLIRDLEEFSVKEIADRTGR